MLSSDVILTVCRFKSIAGLVKENSANTRQVVETLLSKI